MSRVYAKVRCGSVIRMAFPRQECMMIASRVPSASSPDDERDTFGLS
jgi:hypothetical protein